MEVWLSFFRPGLVRGFFYIAFQQGSDHFCPLVLGAVGAAVLAVVTVLALGSEDAQRAEQIAAAQLGPGYQYYTNAIHFSAGGGTSRVQATVQAWNDQEVLAVPVQWTN